MRRVGRPIEGSAVHEDSRIRQHVSSSGSRGAFVALAVVPVLALNSLATADTGDTGAASAADGQRHPRPRSPTRSASAWPSRVSPSRPAEPTATRPRSPRSSAPHLPRRRPRLRSPQRPPAGPRSAPALTDEQRQCLADQGVTLPTRPADGTRPYLTEEQRAALRAGRRGVRPAAPGPRAGERSLRQGADRVSPARLRVADVEPPARQLFHLGDHGRAELVAEHARVARRQDHA